MLASKHKQWVLETIQCLRQRKARPDLERIHKLAGRSHGLTINEIRESLRKLTEEGMVLKVNSRGHMSYRPFNKTVSSVSTSPQNQVYNTSVRILYALRNIMKTTGDGVSFSELENWLVSKNPETRLVKHRLENALVKELKASTITKLSDNCYVLTDTLPKSVPNACVAAEINNTAKDQNLTKKKTETTDSLTLTEKENAKETENTIRGRPLSKRKKFKKTHGPDFENPLLLKKLASKDVIKDVTQDVKCSFCSGTVNSNLQGKKEQLLTCKDCNTKVHPTCMDYSDELAQRALNSPWQCTECKTCCVCDGAQNAKLLLFCDACDMGYHMLCHTQPVSSKPKGKWVCSACKNDQTKPSVADVSDVKPSNKKDSSKPDNISVVLCDEEEDTMETRGKKRKLGQTPGLPLKRQRSVPSKSGEDVRSTTTSPADSPVTSPAKSPVTSPAKSPLTSPFKSSVTSLVKSSVTPSVVEEPVFDDFTDGTVGASCLPTPSPSPTPGDTFDYEMQMSLCGSTFPLLEDATLYTDATDWCMEEVVAFFEGCGFKDCVQTFKEQEIDGRSLLLMKRNDVLTGLGLKLGPALKIHQKIVKLQFHSQAVMSLS